MQLGRPSPIHSGDGMDQGRHKNKKLEAAPGTAFIWEVAMRAILVVNAKGGCGKTTISTNIAAYYAGRGRRTLLADYDVQQSSMDWLAVRPDWREPILGWSARDERVLRLPGDLEVLVMDSPARVEGRGLTDLVRRADRIIVPVLPSPIDIRAAANFIGNLLMQGRLRGERERVAVVANRVRENTLLYMKLRKFLKSLQIPFVATLRDSQNYVRAADEGVGIFELPANSADKDLEQWRPLLRWLGQ